MGTFTTGQLKEEIKDGKVNIVNEGTNKKFIKKVQQITFSAKNAIKNKQDILALFI